MDSKLIVLMLMFTVLGACGGGSSSSESGTQALACTSVEGALFKNDCDFNVYVEVLDGDDDDSGLDFFVPTKSSIALPVTGDFTYGVCKGPKRPEKKEDGFACV